MEAEDTSETSWFISIKGATLQKTKFSRAGNGIAMCFPLCVCVCACVRVYFNGFKTLIHVV